MLEVRIPAFLFFLLVGYVALDLVRLTREARRRRERQASALENKGFKIKVVGTLDMTDGSFTPAKPLQPDHPLLQEEPVLRGNFEKGCPHDGK